MKLDCIVTPGNIIIVIIQLIAFNPIIVKNAGQKDNIMIYPQSLIY